MSYRRINNSHIIKVVVRNYVGTSVYSTVLFIHMRIVCSYYNCYKLNLFGYLHFVYVS